MLTGVAGTVGALVGYGLMTWVPMPDPLVQGLVMPALALFCGVVVPAGAAQARSDGADQVRGTRLGMPAGPIAWRSPAGAPPWRVGC